MAVVRLASVAMVMIGGALAAAPAMSVTHHGKRETTHKAASHHTTTGKSKAGHSRAKKTTHKTEGHGASSAPHGTTAVPSGGLKVYCGPGKDPLLIRKMTQGKGTTVTVICH